MRALTFVGPDRFEVGTRPTPEAGPDESLIAPRFVGICATDLELLEGSHPYFERGVAAFPLQPGHEWSGVVLDSPDPRFPRGARVVADPEVSCGRPDCVLCPVGHVPWCPNRREIGCRGGLAGAAAEVIAIPTRNLHLIPDGVSDRDAVLAEPAVTVLGGLSRVRDVRGARVLVIGAGTIGLIAAQVLVAEGATVDLAVRSTVREHALPGVDTILVQDPEHDPIPETYPIVFCAAGSTDAFKLGLRALGNGGELALLGVPGGRVDQVDVASVLHKDATIHGVLNYSVGGPAQFDRALDALARGVVAGSTLIDRAFPLAEASAAFDRVRDATRPRPKVLLEIAG